MAEELDRVVSQKIIQIWQKFQSPIDVTASIDTGLLATDAAIVANTTTLHADLLALIAELTDTIDTQVINTALDGLYTDNIIPDATLLALFKTLVAQVGIGSSNETVTGLLEAIRNAIVVPSNSYGIARIDDANVPAYYGYLKDGGTGEGYIMKEDTTAGTYTYFNSADLLADWATRAAKTYVERNVLVL